MGNVDDEPVNGGVMETGEVTSVCLMRAGSFVNHDTQIVPSYQIEMNIVI